MSKEVEQRVVEMRFDNKQFEANASTSLSTLDKLKKSLNFTGASKGLNDVASSVKKVDMSGLSTAVETVRARFSALEVVGVTALANITNSAVNAGKKVISALTLDPITTGFQEYETQINAVQTILANTSHQGTTLSDVNAALDELNVYADKTIYNFTEMTRNIGTFTAAGLDLKTSVEAIKGIANLAAVSGSTSTQASTAMYQLSQALAAGTVSLQDWNSVVNAGMGGKVFQDALIRTAAAMKGVSEETFRAQNITSSFRESINAQSGTGWLTTDVLSQTLRQFTGDLTDAELAAMGFTEEQIKNIQQMAVTANDAATKVKTFTQLWDTLKETAQSGWTQTWEIMIGDFEEAKGLLTELSDTFGNMINESSNARNTLLYDSMTSNWKKITDTINEAGLSAEDFKDKVTEIAKEQGVDGDALVTEYGSLEAAFKNGAISSEYLSQGITKLVGTTVDVNKKFEEATKGFENQKEVLDALRGSNYQLNDEQIKSLGLTDQQVASLQELSNQYALTTGSAKEFIDNVSVSQGRELLVDALRVSIRNLVSIFETVGNAWREVFPPATADQVLSITKSIQEFTLALRPSEETLEKLQRTFKGLFSILDIGRKLIGSVLSPIANFFGGGAAASIGGSILDVTANLGDFFTKLNAGIDESSSFSIISDIITGGLNVISDAVSSVSDSVGGFGGALTNVGKGVANTFSWIRDTVAGTFNWIRENVTSADIFALLMGGGVGLAGGGIFALVKKFGGIFDTLKESLENFLSFGKNGSSKFSEILDSVHESLGAFSQGIKVASLVGIATAVGILTVALKKIAELDPGQITLSLITIRLMIASLNSGFKSLVKTLSSFNSKGTIKASAAMVIIATALNVLADAMIKISGMSLGEIAKGLIGVAGGITALSVGIKIIGKSGVNLRTSVAILALAQACKILADALQKFGSMSWDEIAKGLVAMGGALLEFTAVMAVLSKVGGGKSLLGSVSILIASQALDEISENLKNLGSMSWDEIKKGLSAMGGALLEFTVALGILSKVGGFGALLGGTAILVAVQSLDEIAENLKKMGSMAWDEIGRGLVAMGGALGEIGLVTGALGKLAGFSGLLGSAAIWITVQGLQDLYTAFKGFAGMSWDEISRGLSAMAGALAEVSLVSGALGSLTGLSGLLGAGAILLGVQGLVELSEALKSFAGMTWEEIGRGLVGMGSALLELGVIVGLLGKLTGLSGLLGAGAILIGVQGLGDLADALQKFGSMSWEEIGRGLVAMGGALTELAVISGLLGSIAPIAALVGSGSLALATQGLVDLAEALQIFGSMSWDEIGRGLSAMGGALGETAIGGLLNTLSIIGSISISIIASSLGDLADSMKKWENVTVPEGLGDQLGSLASGILSFTFGGLGASTISTLALPLGNLADSVTKWKDVTIPSVLGTDLSSLASGVEAFSFAFVGSWSIASLVGPLGDLADTVQKWKGVVIPANMGDKLSDLAAGVKSFNTSFFSGWSIDGLVEPLGQLADSVRKWTGISLATISANITTFASSLKTLSTVSVDDMVSDFQNGETRVQQAISSMLTSMTNAINNNKSSFIDSIKTMTTDAYNAVNENDSKFETAGGTLVTSLMQGATSRSQALDTRFVTIITRVTNTLNSYKATFTTIGGYLVEGFANGIDEKTFLAEAKAKIMAEAAIKAAMEALAAHSPSKKFVEIGGYVPMGFAKGIEDKADMVKSSSATMAKSAIEATKSTISKIADTINSDIDSEPTIRPVIDLSNVESGARRLNTLFSREQAMSIEATNNRASGSTIQNGDGETTSGSSNTFIQNNYSPKSLSRVEIYRQTKNLLSVSGKKV